MTTRRCDEPLSGRDKRVHREQKERRAQAKGTHHCTTTKEVFNPGGKDTSSQCTTKFSAKI